MVETISKTRIESARALMLEPTWCWSSVWLVNLSSERMPSGPVRFKYRRTQPSLPERLLS